MSAERLGVLERKTKHRTLDHYRRHAELYGPEGVLAAAVDELSAEDVEALSRFVRRRTKARVEDADTLARRVAVLRGERETLNVLVDRASSTNEAERLIRERDGIARRIERCEEELKVAQAACAGYESKNPDRGVPPIEKIGPQNPSPAVGARFGKLTIVGIETDDRRRKHAVCNCDCGTVGHRARLSSVKGGKTVSCGCVRRQLNEAWRARPSATAAEAA